MITDDHGCGLFWPQLLFYRVGSGFLIFDAGSCGVGFRFLSLGCVYAASVSGFFSRGGVHASFVSGFLSRSWWVRGRPGVHHTAPAGLPAAVRLPGAGPELARSIRWIDKRRAQTAGPLNPRAACRRRRVQAHPARPAPTRPCLKCVVETVVFWAIRCGVECCVVWPGGTERSVFSERSGSTGALQGTDLPDAAEVGCCRSARRCNTPGAI